jgi:hypothetical protein
MSAAQAKDWVLEQLKKEASSNSSIRMIQLTVGDFTVSLATSGYSAHGRAARRYSLGIDIRNRNNHFVIRNASICSIRPKPGETRKATIWGRQLEPGGS